MRLCRELPRLQSCRSALQRYAWRAARGQQCLRAAHAAAAAAVAAPHCCPPALSAAVWPCSSMAPGCPLAAAAPAPALRGGSRANTQRPQRAAAKGQKAAQLPAAAPAAPLAEQPAALPPAVELPKQVSRPASCTSA